MNWNAARPVVAVVALVLALGPLMSGKAGAHDIKMHGWTAKDAPPSQTVYWAHGRVNEVNAEKELANITHDPVKELDWPSMTMTFHVAEKALFARLRPHEVVDFALRAVDENRYDIVDVKATNETR
jgi:Cu(I)/Ag(I) efflux system periplasmic protein CusF